MLRMIGVKLEKITDINLYLFTEKELRSDTEMLLVILTNILTIPVVKEKK